MTNKKQKVILKVDDSFLDYIKDNLKEHGKVKITGLGIFELKHFKGRVGYNVATKTKEQFPPYSRVVFRSSQTLKNALE